MSAISCGLERISRVSFRESSSLADIMTALGWPFTVIVYSSSNLSARSTRVGSSSRALVMGRVLIINLLYMIVYMMSMVEDWKALPFG